MRIRTIVLTIVVLAGLLTVGVYVVISRIGGSLPLTLPMPVDHACIVNDGSSWITASASTATTTATAGSSPSAAPGDDEHVVRLDVEQLSNAATITAVGLRRGVPQQALVIALATAWQESKLINLPYGDRDSVGLFQQRTSQGWGKPEQIADPRYAANAFYTALLKVKGWQQLRIADAAQAVQHSAVPEAYQQWAAYSEILAHALSGQVPGAVACTVTDEPSSRGPEAAKTLIAGVRLDWGSTVHTVEVANLVGVALTVRAQQTGWQYAHWLVAHAADQGIKRVIYNDLQWTAKSGVWTHVTQRGGIDAGPAGERVVAEVY